MRFEARPGSSVSGDPFSRQNAPFVQYWTGARVFAPTGLLSTIKHLLMSNENSTHQHGHARVSAHARIPEQARASASGDMLAMVQAQGEVPALGQARWLAAGFAVCAVATGTLLVSHIAGAGAGGGRSFAEMLKAEAANQLSDAFIHGGFIVTLCALMVCFTIWSRMLGPGRVPVIVGMVTFCVGCGGLIASMLVDGFVSPAIAARFADAVVVTAGTGAGGAATDGAATMGGVAMARVLLIFCGTLIRFLMPLGLSVQAVAMVSWSSVLMAGGSVARVVGSFGAICAVGTLVVLLAFPHLSMHLLPGAILGQVIWYLGVAVVLWRQR